MNRRAERFDVLLRLEKKEYMETQNQETFTEEGMTFEQMLNETYAKDNVTEGAIVQGTILALTKDYVIVDVGYKSEGMVPVDQFSAINGEPNKAGDTIDVLVESRENESGLMVLSKEKADRLKVWDGNFEACERDEVVEGIILARVKGGLQVDIGVKHSCRAVKSTSDPCATSTNSVARSSSSKSSSSTKARQHRSESPRTVGRRASRETFLDAGNLG